jgi:ubiquinone/menaquinone biosynthesis C-methylase UbiE
MATVNYDKISEIYDTVRSGDPEVIAYILDSKAVDSSMKVLEIGCGSGNNTVLMKAATGAEVYGMDQSKGMLDKAAAKNGSIHFRQGDALTLDGYSDESFDIVYMVDVIHHIGDIKTMFTNICRVLKSEGMVFVFTDTHDKILNERLTSKYFPETIAVELERYQSTDEILAAIEDSGLKNARLEKQQSEELQGMGDYLIRVAETKGYSMFHLIPEEAIQRGIERIRGDMAKGSISYNPNEYVFVGKK